MRKFRKTRVTRKEYEMSVETMLTPSEIDIRRLKTDCWIDFPFWTELQHLIWLCGAEARGEHVDGIKMVAHVVMNRWKLQYGYFGLTIREIIHKCNKFGVYQFSAANPEDKNFGWQRDCANSTFYKVAKAVIPVYTNQEESPNLRMCYYHAGTIETPKFFKDKLEQYRTVGNHIFFIDPNIPDRDLRL